MRVPRPRGIDQDAVRTVVIETACGERNVRGRRRRITRNAAIETIREIVVKCAACYRDRHIGRTIRRIMKPVVCRRRSK